MKLWVGKQQQYINIVPCKINEKTAAVIRDRDPRKPQGDARVSDTSPKLEWVDERKFMFYSKEIMKWNWNIKYSIRRKAESSGWRDLLNSQDQKPIPPIYVRWWSPTEREWIWSAIITPTRQTDKQKTNQEPPNPELFEGFHTGFQHLGNFPRSFYLRFTTISQISRLIICLIYLIPTSAPQRTLMFVR